MNGLILSDGQIESVILNDHKFIGKTTECCKHAMKRYTEIFLRKVIIMAKISTKHSKRKTVYLNDIISGHNQLSNCHVSVPITESEASENRNELVYEWIANNGVMIPSLSTALVLKHEHVIRNEHADVGFIYMPDPLREDFQYLKNLIGSGDEIQFRVSLLTLGKNDQFFLLVPFFAQLIYTLVAGAKLSNSAISMVMELIEYLLSSEKVDMESNLHQILPSLLSICLFSPLSDDTSVSKSLRERAAELLSDITKRYSTQYITLLPQLMSVVLKALQNRNKEETIHGALCIIMKVQWNIAQLPFIKDVLEKIKNKTKSRNLKNIVGPRHLLIKEIKKLSKEIRKDLKSKVRDSGLHSISR